MALFPTKTVADAQREMALAGMSDGLHYCYRCYYCARLITKIEILEQRAEARPNVCPCGSGKMRPTNAKIWEELFLPRCWKLIFALYSHRLAPAPPPPTPEEEAERIKFVKAAMKAFDIQMDEMRRRAMVSKDLEKLDEHNAKA